MGRIIEGLWDCPYCFTKGIGGSKRECPSCGKPRGDYTKFYMPGKINYVSEEEASQINRNPDWLCEFCGSLNSDSKTTCASCGSERTTENKDYFSMKTDESSLAEKLIYLGEDASDSNYEKSYSTENEEKAHNEKESFIKRFKNFFKDKWKFFLIGALGIVVVLGIIFWLTPKVKEVSITNFEWERSIAIERYQTVDESGWTLPSGGRLKHTKNEIYTYENVLDHYETKSRTVTKQRIIGYEDYVVGYRDLGNGYFEEQRPIYETYTETEYYQEPVYKKVPIYKTKYYYEIDKWIYDRSNNSSGKDKKPFWNEPKNLTSKERESGRTEKYYIIGFDTNRTDKTEKISVLFETWEKLEIGQTVKLKVSILGEGELIE